MKTSKISKIVEYIFFILLIVGIISIPFLGNLYNILKDHDVPNFYSQTIYYQIAFYLCYIIALVIIHNLKNIFTIINKGNPFIPRLEYILKNNSILFMILFIIVFIKTIFIRTLLSIVVFGLCFIISLCFYVLAEVIKCAINYKEEADGVI